MWTEIKSGYYLKYVLANEIYYFYSTNFVRMWECQLSKEELVELIKMNNPSLCGKDDEIIDCCFDFILQRTPNVDANIDVQFVVDANGGLSMQYHFVKLDDYFFKLTMDFSASPPETFCEQVVLPLFSKLKDSQSSEKRLVELLLKKDAEISEYQAGGAILSLKHLKTEKFDINNHDNQYKSSKYSKDFNELNPILNNLEKIFGSSSSEDLSPKKETTKRTSNGLRKSKSPKITVKPEVTVKVKQELQVEDIKPVIIESHRGPEEKKVKQKHRKILNL